MMTVNDILSKHGADLEGIRANIGSMGIDMQLLVRDYKYMSEKIEEIVKRIESFSTYLYCIENHTKLIEKLVHDYESISNQQKEFEQRFRIMDEKEKSRSKIFQMISEQWWKIIMLLSSFTVLVYQLGEGIKHVIPK